MSAQGMGVLPLCLWLVCIEGALRGHQKGSNQLPCLQFNRRQCVCVSVCVPEIHFLRLSHLSLLPSSMFSGGREDRVCFIKMQISIQK